MKKVMKVSVFTIGLIAVLLAGWHLASGQSLAEETAISSTFKGDFLAISDADMIATAYATGKSNKVAGIEDSLIYITQKNGVSTISGKMHATNSVISWPAILEWHPNKKYAYVAETRGKITPDQNKMKNVFYDYPKGQKISIVNYETPSEPVLIQEKAVGENLQNVSINAMGNLLVAGSTKKGKELVIATLKDGLIDQTFYFSSDEIDYSDDRDGGFRTSEFHPTKDIIAVNLNGKKVAFHKVNQQNGEVTIEKIGKALEVEKKLSVGNWHPSGKFYIVSNVNWGKGNLGFAFNKKGHLISIQFDEGGNHKLVSKVKVGLSPEGFDISPNGEYAIALNMRRTYLAKKFWFIPGKKKSSLSLVKINQDTGVLKVIGEEYGFLGTLPEDAIFDKDSNSIAVAVYHDRNEGFPTQGWIDFWEVQNDNLVKTKSKLYVTRGVHNLLLIP